MLHWEPVGMKWAALRQWRGSAQQVLGGMRPWLWASLFTSQASLGHGECLKITVRVLPSSGEESLTCKYPVMPSCPKVCVQGEMPQITLGPWGFGRTGSSCHHHGAES